MIKIIGTNHLMSKEVVEGIIKDFNPEVICLELDELRANMMLQDEETKNDKSDNSILGRITKTLRQKATQSQLELGSDQKTALRYAKNNKIDYFLVDMPIIKTQELFTKIPKEEQIGFQKELSEFESKGELKEVDSKEVLLEMKQRYPIAFEFLINMRNLYISKEILKVMNKNPNKKILCLLGKGHTQQVEDMIK